MNQDQFLLALRRWLGQQVEAEDPSAQDQCMDWAFKGCDILGIDRGTIRHALAYQVWKFPNDQTVAQFEFIPNTANGVPQKGDLPIFDQFVPGVTGEAGHICWATGEGDANTFKSLDQNWNSVTHVTEETHSYVGVLGWLRPRIFRQLEVDQLRTDRDTNYNNWKDTEKALQVSQDALTKCQADSNVPVVSQPQTPPVMPDIPLMKDPIYTQNTFQKIIGLLMTLFVPSR